jgi:SAM-dependent methyltransferase
MSWFDSFDHGILMPDYHRVQLERWLFDKLHRSTATTIDIAQFDSPRHWLELQNYRTLGLSEKADINADLLDLPVSDVDVFICTEVLEHCTDPAKACQQMYEALKKGGKLFLTSPFCWPDHRTDYYEDYWRFTEQGYELLLSDFDEVEIQPIKWTDEGEVFWNMMRRFECMGYHSDVSLYTGYLVEATK